MRNPKFGQIDVNNINFEIYHLRKSLSALPKKKREKVKKKIKNLLDIRSLTAYRAPIWKNMAHDELDKLWLKTYRRDSRKGIKKRKRVYERLAKVMNLPEHKAHLSNFSKKQCEKLYNILVNKQFYEDIFFVTET